MEKGFEAGGGAVVLNLRPKEEPEGLVAVGEAGMGVVVHHGGSFKLEATEAREIGHVGECSAVMGATGGEAGIDLAVEVGDLKFMAREVLGDGEEEKNGKSEHGLHHKLTL